MPTNKQRRDTARRHLERQLHNREARAARQRKINLIASVTGTLVIIAVIVIVIVATNGGNDTNSAASVPSGTSTAVNSPTGSAAPTTAPSTPAVSTTPVSALPKLVAPMACASPGKGSSATFDGVTVNNAYDLSKNPQIVSHVSKAPNALACMDFVVGKGAAATPKSTVSVQYTGALLSNGTVFDGPESHGSAPIKFPLTGVVAGFTQGIGGTGKVSPMKIGGRRLIIMPSQLGYGTGGSGSSIPPNSALIFVVDLKSIPAS